MSSARRLQEDYRRILGITEDTRGLDDELPRMRIEGQRGIWEIGNNELKSGAAAGIDSDGNPRNPVTPTETGANQNADGSGQGDQGTGNGSGGGGSGITDGSDFIIDPEDQLAPLDPFDNTFGDGWGSGSGKITFQDCETEKCIEIVERGGYIPPEGWVDPRTPPPQEAEKEYIEGRWWSGGFWTASEAKAHAAATSTATVCGWDWDNTLKRWEGRIISTISGPQFGNCVQSNIRVLSRACATNPNPTCSTPPPSNPYRWPADNCIQLAPNDNGNWQASNNENPDDMTAKYTQEFSRLELCNSSGETIWIDKNTRGGYTYLNVDKGVWRSTDASGNPRAFGSSSTHKFELR